MLRVMGKILPQYFANQTQPIGTKKAIYFNIIYPCTDNIVYGRFGVVRIFLRVFLAFLGFRVLRIMGKVPVAIFLVWSVFAL